MKDGGKKKGGASERKEKRVIGERDEIGEGNEGRWRSGMEKKQHTVGRGR